MNDIQQAVDILNNGGIIIFPTDTAFGVGCRIDNTSAVEKLFKIRKRPLDQATPVLVSGIEMAKKYWQSIPKEVEENLINKYWSGALTIVLPCNKNLVPSLVRGNGDNLGIRMPDNELILEIIERVGVPILGPSANFHGEVTPYSLSDLSPEFTSQTDLVLDGEVLLNNPSTVIDCSITPWKILRQGAIKINI